MTTPNTPASAGKADFAREAAQNIRSNMSEFKWFDKDERIAADVIQSAIGKAIEPDRAEQDAAPAEGRREINLPNGDPDNSDAAVWERATAYWSANAKRLEKQLAERDAELAEAIEWKDRYQRTAHINARDADTATAKLAEQAAELLALRADNDALKNALRHFVLPYGKPICGSGPAWTVLSTGQTVGRAALNSPTQGEK